MQLNHGAILLISCVIKTNNDIPMVPFLLRITYRCYTLNPKKEFINFYNLQQACKLAIDVEDALL